MAKLQKREKIMLVATGGFLVAFLLYQFLFTKTEEPAPQAARKKVTSNMPPVVIHKSAKGKVADKTIARNASFAPMAIDVWGSDPFREAYRLVIFDTSKIDSARQLILKGIIWKGNRAFVLINDAILMKGEKLGDLKILDIKRDRIICKKGNNLLTLFLDNKK